MRAAPAEGPRGFEARDVRHDIRHDVRWSQAVLGPGQQQAEVAKWAWGIGVKGQARGHMDAATLWRAGRGVSRAL